MLKCLHIQSQDSFNWQMETESVFLCFGSCCLLMLTYSKRYKTYFTDTSFYFLMCSYTKTHVLNSRLHIILHSGDGMGMHYGYNAFLLPMGSSCGKPGFWCQALLTFLSYFNIPCYAYCKLMHMSCFMHF